MSDGPVLVVTVYRRYLELDRFLTHLWGPGGLAEDLPGPPEVVIVWACPEESRLWYFQRQLREGRVHRVLPRAPLGAGIDGDGVSTTRPESINIRLGLEYAREHYPRRWYVVQAADVMPRKDRAYRRVCKAMCPEAPREPAKLAVFNWLNGVVVSGAFHTNFFAATADERYWPPVARPGEADVLEWMWGKRLRELSLPGVSRDTNVNQYWFTHDHLSESNPPWPRLARRTRLMGLPGGLDCSLTGWRPWWERLGRRLLGRPV